MSNQDIADLIFDKIEMYGFKPYEMKYNEDHSKVTFRVKGVWKRWIFGIWIHSYHFDANSKYDTSSAAEIFCRYDTDFDNFDCDQISLFLNVSKKYIYNELNNENNDYGDLWKLKRFLYSIRYHPFLNYYIDNCYHNPEYFDEYFIKFFISEEIKRMYSKYKERFDHFVTKRYLIRSKKIFDKLFCDQKSYFIDWNSRSIVSTHRYVFKMYFKNQDDYSRFDTNLFAKVFPKTVFFSIIEKNSTIMIFINQDDGKYIRYIL